jgi:hypothetical protein
VIEQWNGSNDFVFLAAMAVGEHRREDGVEAGRV